VAIRINRPHPNALLGLPADLREVASASVDADPDRRYSIRTFMAYANLRESLGSERAAGLVFGKNAKAIMDAIKIDEVSK
jgi:hypothetical protein